jgi:asparagine synthase (glutamine-hydrolysing)
MLLARDRVGKKPLFYSANGRRFTFASEIKAILAVGAGSREPDLTAIHDYLTYLYFPPPRTAFRSISKLPPATCCSVEVGVDGSMKQKVWPFWDPLEEAGAAEGASEEEYVDRLRGLLEDAVQSRLLSDVPLGIFLSGGIDSSAITAVASRYGRERVRTFSVSFPAEKAYDELPFADLVAKTFRTEHSVLRPDAHCVDLLPTVIRHFDEPFGNPTAILEYALTKLMRQHVTVALSGDGGDELFGGYERYRGARFAEYYRLLPRLFTTVLGPRLAGLIRDDTTGRHVFRRVREFGESAGLDEAEMYIRWVGYFSEADKRRLYTAELSRQVAGHDSGEFLRDAFRRAQALPLITRLGYVDLLSFLSCNCLEYADRMSMANSLEVRCPFTDQQLVQFAFTVPDHFKVRRGQTKWLLKRSLRGTLPDVVLDRRKVGFNPPAPQWLNGELKPIVGQLLAPERVKARGLFQPTVVSELIEDHRAGARDNTFKIWALMVLELWYSMYQDNLADPISFSAAARG